MQPRRVRVEIGYSQSISEGERYSTQILHVGDINQPRGHARSCSTAKSEEEYYHTKLLGSRFFLSIDNCQSNLYEANSLSVEVLQNRCKGVLARTYKAPA